jgi:hypothetical protein
MTAPSPGPTVSVSASVPLLGASEHAKTEFRTAVQSYADHLAAECGRQEISDRAPGVTHPEITTTVVMRAKTVMSRYGERAKPRALEVCALVGLPIFSAASGVLGSYLHSILQIVSFICVAALGIACVVVLAWRRLL